MGRALCAAVALIALLLSACSDSATGPPSTVVVVRPEKGDVLTFRWVQTDSAGGEIPSTVRVIADTVADPGESFLGRDSVTRFVSAEGGYRIYYHANGDISIPWALTNDTAETPRWLLLSTRDGAPTSLPTVTWNDGVVVTTFRVSTLYLGRDSVEIEGRTVPAAKIRITQTTEDQSAGNRVSGSDVLDISFAPDLGCFVRWNYLFVNSGSPIGGFTRVMTGR